jgi:excisionase family DNA binding protein
MHGDSYTLREVAELLGVSKRTLQRRIREGAFPRRFLSPGRHGMETRIPAADVHSALDELSTPDRSMVPTRYRDGATIPPARDLTDALVPYGGSALTAHEIEALQTSVLEVVRDEREAFLAAVREALASRDAEVLGLRSQMGALQAAFDRLRRQLEGAAVAQAAAVPIPRETEAPPEAGPPAFDVSALLREIDEIEALLVGLRGATPDGEL